jgi:hypothetical protein
LAVVVGYNARVGETNMKDEQKEQHPISFAKKPPRAIITKEESLRRMRTIDEWRKKELEELRKPHAKDSR